MSTKLTGKVQAMKTANVIKHMQNAYRQAEHAFSCGNFQGAVASYRKALTLCQSLPESTNFDRSRFEASVQAGLSGALGNLGKHLESLAAANKALAFYDQHGENYPVDTGRWLMAQVNQGTALASLGCFPAALEALGRAKEIFVTKGLDAAQNKEWLKMVDSNIAVINVQLKKLQ
jgi:tetratricopeptide (TPR) repeat protein